MFDPKQLDAMLGDDPQSQFLAAIGLHPAQKAIRETLGNELHGQAAPQVVQKPDVAPGAPAIESSAIPALSPGASPTAASGAPASPTGLKAGIAAPAAEATEHPAVNVPKVSGIEQNKAELQRQITTGSGISQIKNPFLRTLARVGDIAGTAMFPAVTAAIPGTELHHRIGIHDLEHDIGQQEGAAKSEADTRETNANANRLEHPEDQVPKSPEGQVFKSLVDGGVPPLEAYKLVHPETRETPEAKAFDAALKANGGDAIKAYQAVKAAGRDDKETGADADAAYRALVKKKQLGQALTADETAEMKAYEKQKTLNTQFQFNLQNAGATGSQGKPGAIAQGLADGTIKWQDVVSVRTPMSIKQALLSEVKAINPNFNSGDFTVEQKVRESFTSGDYSKKLNSIATAREHMKVFMGAAEALNNGDTRSLNKVGNALNVEFGDDAVTNFNIAKQFFSGEVGQAVTAGQGTEGERSQLADSINNASSWKQLSGALKTADALLAGKQKTLHDTYKSGASGQPNFGGEQQHQVGERKTFPNGKVGIWDGHGWEQQQ
jgi:hypothetical protein